MEHLQFVTDYKKNEQLRTSFTRLAADTFGLELNRWYQEGFWDEGYIPFSYAAGEQIVANVSVNPLDVVIGGSSKKAVQLGTVMTHPDYRQQGLSAALMNKVMEAYSSSCDFMYLFANDSVLDFYPRFGFTPVREELLLPHMSRSSSLTRSRPLYANWMAPAQRIWRSFIPSPPGVCRCRSVSVQTAAWGC